MGNPGSISAPQHLGLVSPDQFHYLVGNVINSEHYLLKLIFKLRAIHVIILRLEMEGLTALVCPSLTDGNVRGLQRNVTLAYFYGTEATKGSMSISQTGSQ